MSIPALVAMLLEAAHPAVADADVFSATTSSRRAELLMSRWGKCGEPTLAKLADGRFRVWIRLPEDADYVVLDCVANQAKGFRIKQTSKRSSR